MNRCISLFGAVCVIGSVAALGGCEEKPAATTTPAPTGASPAADKHDDHDHATGEAHDEHEGHDHAEGEGHDDHGATVELGTGTIGAFQVKASRDGEVAEGGEAAVDLWVTPAAPARVGAVRAWIGLEDAKGSIKAKLDLEKDNYHGHVEVPKPIPAGSKLWVEIEDDKGARATGSFDLKA